MKKRIAMKLCAAAMAVTLLFTGCTMENLEDVGLAAAAGITALADAEQEVAEAVQERTADVDVQAEADVEADTKADAEEEAEASGYEFGELVGTPSDYSDEDNWLRIPDITKEVDTFYIYPTSYIDNSDEAPLICAIDEPVMREGAEGSYASSGELYEQSTNVFAPFYRHTNLKAAIGLTADEYLQFQCQEQRTDIYAALDYYFENYNNGRPFILAGHSQGSCMCKLVLLEYMKLHPEYYDRMVAAYVLGFSVTKDELEAHPYLKFAEGESDTGVIISWNTEGKGNKDEQNIVVAEGAISINPLNWKRDETYASTALNLGCHMTNEDKTAFIVTKPGYADAQLDTERGVVVTTQDVDGYIKVDVPGFETLFGPASYHNGDYGFYYYNIQDNVAKRIAAYHLANEDYKITGLGEPTADYSDSSNWINIPEITKEIDTFYIYPTAYMAADPDAPIYCGSQDKGMRANATNNFEANAPVYMGSTNVFAPFYSQTSIYSLKGSGEKKAAEILSGEPRTDIYAALDYYFENYNNGRPFILAGHSQGAMMIRIILKDYMQAHPEYYQRMVAAYAIGYSITQNDLDEYPYLRFAEGATDTGVIISWNTEGKGNSDSALVVDGAISINPINWRRDDTYASAAENLGSQITDSAGTRGITVPGVADAQVDLKRGVVICTNTDYPYMDTAELTGGEQVFGTKSFHGNDYSFYFVNIRDNVRARVEAYKAKN